MEDNQTLDDLQNRVMKHFTIDANGHLKDKDQTALKEQVKDINLTPTSERIQLNYDDFEKYNSIQVSPFAYELDGSYQAITEHPTIHTYASNEDGETVCINESIDTSCYGLKDKANTFEAINRLGYFEALMKKYNVKGIAELELMIETYIDERGEY